MTDFHHGNGGGGGDGGGSGGGPTYSMLAMPEPIGMTTNLRRDRTWCAKGNESTAWRTLQCGAAVSVAT